MSKFRLRGRRRKNHESREGSVPLRAIVPNLITSMAACGGITAIVLSATNYAKTLAGQDVAPRDWRMGFIALLVACLCDAMDGRVARLLKASSKLGAELDSLADFVNFGVAPAMFLYFWVLAGGCAGGAQTVALGTQSTLLAFALFYAMCDAFRLARFNTMLEQPTLPYWKHFFLGVPAPGGCWMVMTPVMLAHALPDVLPAAQAASVAAFLQSPSCAMFMLFLVGVLMASRLPTPSFKAIHVTRKHAMPTLALLLFLIAFFATHFWLTLGVIGAGYILTVPAVGFIFLKVRARYLRDHGGDAQGVAHPPDAA